MNDRIDYRGHTVVRALLRGEHAAQVYRGRRRIGKERFTGPSAQAVLDEAKTSIDTTWRETLARRRWVDMGSEQPYQVGTAEEYAAFFEAEMLPESHRAMLVGHAAAPGRTLSAGAIARCAGWHDFSAANLQYGLLGARVADYLELKLRRREDGSEVSTCAIATSADPSWSTANGTFRWVMHEEVADALRLCNMLGLPPTRR